MKIATQPIGRINKSAKIAIQEALGEYLEGVNPEICKNFTFNNLESSNSIPFKRFRGFLTEYPLELVKIKTNARKVAQKRLECLQVLFGNIQKHIQTSPSNFLDIGSGNGQVTQKLCNLFGLKTDNTTGLEILKDHTHNSLPFRTTIYGGNNIFEAVAKNRFDLISSIATLHHSNNPIGLFRQSYDALKEGGYMILQEHNTRNNSDAFFHSTMDEFEYRVIEDNPKLEVTNQYKTASEWLGISKKIGFKLVSLEEPEGKNPFRRFVALFTK